MALLLDAGLFGVGLGVVFSAERLVESTVGVSRSLGVSAFLVGVVAIGFNAGAIALLRPVPVGATTRIFYLPVCGAALLLSVGLMTAGRVPRWGGALLLGMYVVFVSAPLL